MAHTSTPAPTAPLAVVLALLAAAGFRTVDNGTHRGNRVVWFDGGEDWSNLAGLHGTLNIGAKSGVLNGAQILPRGESGPVENIRGGRAVADRLTALLAPAPAVDELPGVPAAMAEILAEYCAA